MPQRVLQVCAAARRQDRRVQTLRNAATASPSTPTGRPVAKVRARNPFMSPQRQFPSQLAAGMEQLTNTSGADGPDYGGRRDAGDGEAACGHREEPVGTDSRSPATVDSCGGSDGSSVDRVAAGAVRRRRSVADGQDGSAMTKGMEGRATMLQTRSPEAGSAVSTRSALQRGRGPCLISGPDQLRPPREMAPYSRVEGMAADHMHVVRGHAVAEVRAQVCGA